MSDFTENTEIPAESEFGTMPNVTIFAMSAYAIVRKLPALVFGFSCWHVPPVPRLSKVHREPAGSHSKRRRRTLPDGRSVLCRERSRRAGDQAGPPAHRRRTPKGASFLAGLTDLEHRLNGPLTVEECNRYSELALQLAEAPPRGSPRRGNSLLAHPPRTPARLWARWAGALRKTQCQSHYTPKPLPNTHRRDATFVAGHCRQSHQANGHAVPYAIVYNPFFFFLTNFHKSRPKRTIAARRQNYGNTAKHPGILP